ncbi:hypothetical protein GCM10009745_80240 [Kribbella yunnanensis]|uniref:Uncharacterized protein n=1 Tax=Kribbella yunnanensis TaxID=190194 RepID=A0ABN2J6Z3_9ACTN
MNTLLEAGLGSAERILGSRFLLSVLMPVLLTAGASGGVALAATGSTPGDAIQAWQRYSGSGQFLATLWVVLGLVGSAYLLAVCHLPFLRLIEGYWPEIAPLRHLRERRTKSHRRVAESGWQRVAELHAAQAHLRAAALATQLSTRYPPRRRLIDGCLPTALGNHLRAAEFYPLERYGIDAVVIWPRLLPLLAPEAIARVNAARTALDTTVTLLGLATAFGAVWPLVLLASGSGALAALPLLAWPMAWCAHRASLQAATAFGQEVAVVFDLYRHKLPHHLELVVPADPDEERRMWDDLGQFYLRNLPLPPGLQIRGGGPSAS